MIDQKFHRVPDGSTSGPGDDDSNSAGSQPDGASAFAPYDMFALPQSPPASTSDVAEDRAAPSAPVVSNKAVVADSSGTSVLSDTPVSPSLSDEVSFVSGVTAAGAVASISGGTYIGDGTDESGNATGPAQYSTVDSFANKWSPAGVASSQSTIGSAGGTQYYFFDNSGNAASQWTASEETALTSGLNLWSAVANIQFVQTTDRSLASLTFEKQNSDTDTGDYEFAGNLVRSPINSTQVYNQGAGTTIHLAPADDQINLGDFNRAGAFGLNGVTGYVHEEGHFLGLNHGGPYNGGGARTPASSQFSAYDNDQYSVMSYNVPDDTTATYYSDNPNPGANYLNGGALPVTWMPVDIMAVQRLYGAATGGPLNSGGQVFGYHDNIDLDPMTGLPVVGGIHDYFDFAKNPTPVLTLYDTGANNTLDLSGDMSVETIDLNGGRYSSFSGLAENLAIAFGTAIDNFVGGTDGETVTTNTDSDNLVGGIGGVNTAVFSGALASYTLSQVGDAEFVVNNATSATDQLTNFQFLQFSDQTVPVQTACYARGTHIVTPTGDVSIEDLAVGDLVLTASGEARPVRWLGHRAVDIAAQPDPEKLWPIVVRAGAFADGIPARDLFVSPEHALVHDGVMIPAYLLANGRTVLQVKRPEIEYWHVELDTHDLILAEGMPAETYLDCGNRGCFVECETHVELYPDFQIHGEADSCLPRVSSGARFIHAKAALLARAKEQGHEMDAADDLHIIADGQRFEPTRISASRIAFLLPPGCADISLLSRSFVPAHSIAESTDGRLLGVCLTRLQLDGEDIALGDDAACDVGWQNYEEHATGRGQRWTTGATPLPANTMSVMADIVGRGVYWSPRRQGNVVALFG